MAQRAGGVSRRKLLAGSAAAATSSPCLDGACSIRIAARKVSMRSSATGWKKRLPGLRTEGRRRPRLSNRLRASRAQRRRCCRRASRAGAQLGPIDGASSTSRIFRRRRRTDARRLQVLADAAPATADAPVLRRLRAAGAVIVAKTNMSSSLSLASGSIRITARRQPDDRARVPGGSSSGAASRWRMGCARCIGTDTAGSTRIPAAVCGIVGYKPSKFRVPRKAHSHSPPRSIPSASRAQRRRLRCWDAVMAGDEPWALEPQTVPDCDWDSTRGCSEGLDQTVRHGSRGHRRHEASRVRLSEEGLRSSMKCARQRQSQFSSVESYAIHRQWLATRAADYDPNVARGSTGATGFTRDYMNMVRERSALARARMRVLPISTGWFCRHRRSWRRPSGVSASGAFLPKNLLILRKPRSRISSTCARFLSRCLAKTAFPSA